MAVSRQRQSSKSCQTRCDGTTSVNGHEVIHVRQERRCRSGNWRREPRVQQVSSRQASADLPGSRIRVQFQKCRCSQFCSHAGPEPREAGGILQPQRPHNFKKSGERQCEPSHPNRPVVVIHRGLACVHVAPAKAGRIHTRSGATMLSSALLPERFGLIEARVRLAGAIEQLRDLRLLVAHDEARGKRAVAVLLLGQAAPRPGQDIRA